MLNKVKRLIKSLRLEASGNVLMLFALGTPVFIGGAGLAVDTAQWYMWKREMQYAVDQAALAGAWSRVGGTTGNEYKERAKQEIAANLQVVDFADEAAISLAKYETTGVDNSVLVTLSASKELPFSSFLTGSAATIAVKAQATFEQGRTFTACLIAVDPDTKGAITIGGSAYVKANCGAAALSGDDDAIVKNGSESVFDVGYLVATGGIDDDFDGNPDLKVYENQRGLVDPFADLSPPNNSTPRTFSCPSATTTPGVTTYTAVYTDHVSYQDWTYTRASATAQWVLDTTKETSKADDAGSPATGPATASTTKQKYTDVSPTTSVVTTGSVQTITPKPAQTCTTVKGVKTCVDNPVTYKRVDAVKQVYHFISDVTSTTSPSTTTPAGPAMMEPGTYSDFTVSCNTVMAPGVYVIDAGNSNNKGFIAHSQYSITGQGVMIVLKNGAQLDINGGSEIQLKAMDTPQMVAAGISQSEALKLKDMLIFEDRNSSGAGSSGDKLNGNAGAILDGTVYLPKSKLSFGGTFTISSGAGRCMILTARKIVIEGNAHMESFCPSTEYHGVSIGGGVTSVRLVT